MTTRKKMTSKYLIFLTTCVFVLVHGGDVEKRENAESYITKEAAKELRNKLSHIKSDEQQDDYDEILKEIIHTIQSQEPKDHQQEQQNPQNTIFYEKKYFDYLPNEISDSDDVTNEDLSHELVKKHSEHNSFEDEQHMVNNDAINIENGEHEKHSSGRKIVKRDVMQQDDENKARSKRQNIYYVPLSHYNPYPRVHYFYPSHDPFLSDIFNSLASESRQTSYAAVALPPQQQYGFNPWTPQNNPNLRLHSPYNYYLPPASQPSQTYLPVAPTNRPPINVPSPPDNQQGSEIPFDDRISGFEGPDQNPIWGINTVTQKTDRNFGKRPTNPPKFEVSRPDQNQKRPSNNPNDIDYDGIFAPNEKPAQVDIEYAPELVDDVTSTTRAPLKIPNRKKNQQNNRQKKEEFETTTRPPSTTVQSTNIVNSLYPQQVNRTPKKPLPACVEAIVNCCSRYDEVVRVPCFEAHNCNGAFFGRSPCSRDIKQAAFKEVEKYTN